MARIYILLLGLLLVGCTESARVVLTEQVSVYVSHSDGQQQQLSAKDNAYNVLNDWLEQHQDDWMVTSGRFPGGVYIKSGEHGIQITKTHVILYTTKSEKPEAMYIQGLDKDDLVELKQLGQEELHPHTH